MKQTSCVPPINAIYKYKSSLEFSTHSRSKHIYAFVLVLATSLRSDSAVQTPPLCSYWTKHYINPKIQF